MANIPFLNNAYFSAKVGIGTDSPGAKLDVSGDVLIDSGEYLSWGTVGATSIEGSTASNKLQFRTSSTDRMIINDTGVGIGVTSPSAKLHVSGDSTLATQGTVLRIENTSDTGSSQDIHIYNQYDRDIGIKFETLGGTNYIWQDSNSDDALIFTAGGNARATDSTLILKQDHNASFPLGSLGVGLTSPTADLHVQGSSATEVPIIRSGGFGNSGSKLELAETLTSGNMTYGYSFFNDGNSSNTLQIKTHNNSTAGVTAITINRTNALTTFSTVPIVGTRTAGDNTTYAASTAFVTAAITAAAPTVNDGTLTMTTTAGLDGGATFTANQSGNSAFAVSLDLSELADMTQTMVGSDEFIVLDNSAERRKAASEIGLSIFDNDAGFTSNTGDITAVVAGDGLTGGGTSGSVTLNVAGGDGITANADDIEVDSTVVRTTGAQSIAGFKTFTDDSMWTGGNSFLINDAATATAALVRVPAPGGAGYDGPSNSTGAIKIKMPVATFNNNVMMSFDVKIYDYTLNESLDITISGYAYTPNNWNNQTVVTHASLANRDYTVRFGDDGTSHCVWIGELTSTWKHLKIGVFNFIGGHTVVEEEYGSGWDISVVSAFDTVQDTKAGNLPVAKTATTLQTARTIAGVSFNGSANISLNNNAITNGAGYITNGGVTGFLPLAGGTLSSPGNLTVNGDVLLGGSAAAPKTITIQQIGVTTTDANAVMQDGNGVLKIRTLGTGAFGPTPVGAYLLDTTDTFTGALTINGDIRGNGQQLVLNAGESYNYATGQTNEYVYANAENGLIVSSSPDNWASGWAGRNTTTINNASGNSTFANDITVSGGDITLGGTGRIQGVDTVSASTDAANKAYVDATVAGNDDYVQKSSLGQIGNSNVAFGSTAGWPNNPTAGFYQPDYVGYSGLVFMTGDVSGSTSSIGFEMAYNGNFKIHSNTDSSSWTSHTVLTSTSAPEALAMNQYVRTTDTVTFGGGIITSSTQTRDKISVWSGLGTYTIGMKNGYGYGGLGGAGAGTDYAMSFQMSANDTRGWWWGDSGMTDVQGSMSLTTDGKLVIAKNISVGFGEDTTTGGVTNAAITALGNQTFGIPGGGTNTNSRYLSIEGNADGSGEGSGRMFFTEHNSSTAAMDNYGMSLAYRGGGASIVGASGNTWTGLTQIGNGQWGMFGHNNSAPGALIMSGDRAATYVEFHSNDIKGAGDIYVADQIIHTGDTDTYLQFHAANQFRIVTGGTEMLEVNDTYVQLGADLNANNKNLINVEDIGLNDRIYHDGDTNTYMQFHATDQWRVVTSGAERLEVSSSATKVTSGNFLVNAGNVGIGTTSPTSPIGSTRYINVKSTGNGEIILDHTDAGATSDLGLYSWARNADHLAHIKASCDGSTSAAFISFHAQPSGGSFSSAASNEKMRIKSNGYVGIGTTSPDRKLDIVSGTNNGIRISATDTTSNWRDISIRSYVSEAQANALGDSTHIYTSSPAGTTTETPFSYYGATVIQGRDNGNGGLAIRLGNGSGHSTMMWMGSTGVTVFSNTVTATNFILSSDERLKENIEKACDNRIKADWKTFELKTDKGQKRYGVIAQELEKTNPEFVREDTQGFKSVAYIDLLIAKIAELEARLEKLEK